MSTIQSAVIDVAVARLGRLRQTFLGHRAGLLPFLNRIWAHYLINSPLGRAADKNCTRNSVVLLALNDALEDHGISRRYASEPAVIASAAARALLQQELPPAWPRSKRKTPASTESLAAMAAYAEERIALLEQVMQVTRHFAHSLPRELRAWQWISALLAELLRGEQRPPRPPPIRKPPPPIALLPPETVAAHAARLRQIMGGEISAAEQRRDHGATSRRLHDERCDLQLKLAVEFGDRRGWRLSEASFSLAALARGGRETLNYDSLLLDHPYFYRQRAHPYRPAGLAVHLYGWDAMKHLRAVALAAQYGLVAEPVDFPSWWNPGWTKLVLYRRAPATEQAP